MVITLDKRKQPLGVCTERRARILLEKRRACVYKRYPFTIIIKDADVRKIEPSERYKIKIDPGAKYTGIAVIRESDNAVVFFQQIEHRGEQVKSNLDNRRNTRRNRRQRETRYRRPKWGNTNLGKDLKPKFDTSRSEGWLPPSVRSVADNTISWVVRLKKLFYITDCSFEAVRFDTQILDNPDISGIQYQQGQLFGYEVKEYLLNKYGHTCQYCGGASEDRILEWEHILPKSRGGSDSIKNATLACHTCNQEKGNMTPEEWLLTIRGKRKLDNARKRGIQQVIDQKVHGCSNRYCAWVNASRRYMEHKLLDMFEHVECSSGGRTKYNRTKLEMPKEHHYDALCVGTVPNTGYLDLTNGYYLYAKAIGRGSRLRGQINKCGVMDVKFTTRAKQRLGFINGDIVRADVPKGKYAGTHMGRVMTRASGYFDIRRVDGSLVTVKAQYCRCVQKDNGYLLSYKIS